MLFGCFASVRGVAAARADVTVVVAVAVGERRELVAASVTSVWLKENKTVERRPYRTMKYNKTIRYIYTHLYETSL